MSATKGVTLNFLSSGYKTQKGFLYQHENAQKYFVRFEVYVVGFEVCYIGCEICVVWFEAFIRDMEIARPKRHKDCKKRGD